MTDADPTTRADRWRTVPGLLDLIEAGEPLDDLANRDVFVPPVVRSGGAAAYLARLCRWLQGYNRDRVLAERVPVWVPLAELWAPPGGSAELTYEALRERSARAEVTLFGAAGFGAASITTLSESLTFAADDDAPGRAFLVRAFVTVTRYVRATDGSSFERVDVHNGGEVVERRLDDLGLQAFPFASRSVSEAQLRGRGYVPRAIVRIAGSAESERDTYEPKVERTRNWSAEIALPEAPLLKAPLKLGAAAGRSEAFSVKFSLPRGSDYVFFTRDHESPIVPWCAHLQLGGDL